MTVAEALSDVIRGQVALAEAAETLNERPGDLDAVEKRLRTAQGHVDLALRRLGLDESDPA